MIICLFGFTLLFSQDTHDFLIVHEQLKYFSQENKPDLIDGNYIKHSLGSNALFSFMKIKFIAKLLTSKCYVRSFCTVQTDI